VTCLRLVFMWVCDLFKTNVHVGELCLSIVFKLVFVISVYVCD